jgi:mannose-1-phosphate guanylyltransferase
MMRLLGERTKVVILAGGQGERLWPRSTPSLPKQFLQFDGERSLLRRTYERACTMVAPGSVYVMTARGYEHLVRWEMPEIPDQNLILEPVGRSTAPALGLAALWASRSDPEAILIALPSDHRIGGERRFEATLMAAVQAAEAGWLVTMGIRPSRPESGYGYIRKGPLLTNSLGLPVFQAAGFVEKPERAAAQAYCESGEYLWNSGILVGQAKVLRGEIARFLPEVSELLDQLEPLAVTYPQLQEQVDSRFAEMPTISIDYGVLERSDRVAVVPAYFEWSDIGDWAALGRLWLKDDRGNAVRGDALVYDADDLVVDANGGRLVVVVGARDLVVVDTEQAVLICPKDRAQSVKEVAGLASFFAEAIQRARSPEGQGG